MLRANRGPLRQGIRVVVLAALLGSTLMGAHPAFAESPVLQVVPATGPVGTEVTVSGSGFAFICSITVSFTDATGTYTTLGGAPKGPSFSVQAVIPGTAAPGTGTVTATQGYYNPGTHRCYSWMQVHRATTTFTVTPATSSQLLANPGFEYGLGDPAPWVSTARINDSSAEQPHSGSWDAWLGGTGTTHSDSLFQDVAVPAAITSANLAFWLHVDSADTGTTAHDVVKVQVRNLSNAPLATLGAYSNLDAASGYTQRTFDLTAYAGQTIRVWLGSREDASLQTSFVVDDFSLTTT